MAIERDPMRPRLQEALRVLRAGPPFEFVTTNWTLYEALAVSQRRGKAFAVGLYSLVSTSMEVMPVPELVESEALRQFLAWRDKSASVVDHANALVAAHERCDAILSYDLDFVPLAAAAGLAIIT
jgi:predicted nucleic acid-binding protein